VYLHEALVVTFLQFLLCDTRDGVAYAMEGCESHLPVLCVEYNINVVIVSPVMLVITHKDVIAQFSQNCGHLHVDNNVVSAAS